MSSEGFLVTSMEYTPVHGRMIIERVSEPCLISVWPRSLAVDLIKIEFPEWSHAELPRRLDNDTEDMMRDLWDVATEIDNGSDPAYVVDRYLDEAGIDCREETTDE